MAIRTEQVSLDIQPCCDARGPVVCGRQGDEGTVLNVTVTQNGQAVPLDGLTATLLGNNPKLLQLAGAVSGSTATFTLPSAFFSAACIVRLYVQLSQGEDVVASTQTFTLKVAPGADLSASQAQGYVPQLDEALAAAKQASQTAEAAAAQATQAVDDANAALETANTAVQNANDATAAANAAASNANSAAQAARGNVLKGTVTDASVAHVEDAYAGAVAKEIRVKGKTRQNLWRNPVGTSNGVTAAETDDGALELSGTASGFVSIGVETFALKPSTSYTISVDKNPGTEATATLNVREKRADGSYIDSQHNASTGGATFTTSSDMASCECMLVVISGTTVSGTYRVMLNEGSEPEPWCPPGLNGVDELSIVTSGKNLAHGELYKFGTTNVRQDGDGGGIYLAAGTYTISADIEGLTLSQISVGTNYDKLFIDYAYNANEFTFTLDNAQNCFIDFYHVGGIDVSQVNSVQLELGSTATAYEPPAVTATPIDLDGHQLRSLPDGTCDVLVWDETGAVSVEQNVDEYKASGNEQIYFNNDVGEFSFALQNISMISWDAFLCDVLPVVVSTGSVDLGASIGGKGVYFKVPGVDDADKAKQWLAANMPTLIYPCTQQTTDLDPATMPALPESTANVWAACDPPTELDMTYERDLTIAYDNLASQIATTAAAFAVAQATD